MPRPDDTFRTAPRDASRLPHSARVSPTWARKLISSTREARATSMSMAVAPPLAPALLTSRSSRPCRRTAATSRLAVGGLRDVRHERHRSRHALGRGLQPILAAGREQHGHAPAGETLGQREADAGRAARDERNRTLRLGHARCAPPEPTRGTSRFAETLRHESRRESLDRGGQPVARREEHLGTTAIRGGEDPRRTAGDVDQEQRGDEAMTDDPRLRKPGRRHRPRVRGRHRDAVGPGLGDQGARPGERRVLRAAVGSRALERHAAGDRDDVDDPAVALDELRPDREEHADQPEVVQIECRPIVVDRGLVEGYPPRRAGALHEEIATPACGGGACELRDIRIARDVAGDRLRAQRACGVAEPVGVARREHEVPATAPSEQSGHLETDTARPSRDHRGSHPRRIRGRS